MFLFAEVLSPFLLMSLVPANHKLKTSLIQEVKHCPKNLNQRTNGPVNAHLISWPSKAKNIQNLENIW